MKKAALALLVVPLLVLPLLFMSGGESKETGLVNVPSQYVEIVLRAGSICEQIPPSIIAAQIEQESGWDPNAVSSVGAAGIAQFMPETWAVHGMDGDGDGKADIFNAFDSIWSQGNYMCFLAGEITSRVESGILSGSVLSLALAAYNAGLGNVEKYGGVPPFKQTQKYVENILANAVKYVGKGGGKGSADGNKVVAGAQKYFGVPYVWGGMDGSGLDCSGLVWRVYADLGVTLPVRTADAMANWSGANLVNRESLSPGDLIAFRYANSSTYHHIGIYAGVDAYGVAQMIHAPTFGGVVEQVPLNTAYWQGMSWKTFNFNTKSK